MGLPRVDGGSIGAPRVYRWCNPDYFAGTCPEQLLSTLSFSGLYGYQGWRCKIFSAL